MIRSIIIFLFVTTGLVNGAWSQAYQIGPTGVGLSGGSVMLPDGHSLRSSIGEAMTDTWNISAGELGQGFQQTLDGAVTAADGQLLLGSLSSYPQPASEVLYIKWNGEHPLALRLTWLDMSGRDVQGSKRSSLYFLPGEEQRIELSELPPGSYLLQASADARRQLVVWPVIRLP